MKPELSIRFDVLTVALLAIATLPMLALLTGSIGSDDFKEFHFSQELAAPQPFERRDHHGGRPGFLLLLGVPAALGGARLQAFRVQQERVHLWLICRPLGI